MNEKLQRVIDLVNNQIGVDAAYAVSVAFHAADTLRQTEPDKFKLAWGEMGCGAISDFMAGQPNTALPPKGWEAV